MAYTDPYVNFLRDKRIVMQTMMQCKSEIADKFYSSEIATREQLQLQLRDVYDYARVEHAKLNVRYKEVTDVIGWESDGASVSDASIAEMAIRDAEAIEERAALLRSSRVETGDEEEALTSESEEELEAEFEFAFESETDVDPDERDRSASPDEEMRDDQ